MNVFNTSLPLEAVASESPAVVLAEDLRIVSEHESTRDAEKGLCEFEKENPDGTAMVFRRIGSGWAQN